MSGDRVGRMPVGRVRVRVTVRSSLRETSPVARFEPAQSRAKMYVVGLGLGPGLAWKVLL